MTPPARPAAGSRAQRVAIVLHNTGHVGMTVAQIAATCELKPSDAKQVCKQLVKEGHATVLAARRDPATQTLEDVYGCRCHVDHRPPEQQPQWRPLTEEEKERGRRGLAGARAALEGETP